MKRTCQTCRSCGTRSPAVRRVAIVRAAGDRSVIWLGARAKACLP